MLDESIFADNGHHFARRIVRALERGGIKTVNQVGEAKDADLLRIPEIGMKSLREIRRVIPSRKA